MDEPLLLQLAAIILAIRTARIDEKEFRGMASPRIAGEVHAALWMARSLRNRADNVHRQHIEADQADAARQARGGITPP